MNRFTSKIVFLLIGIIVSSQLVFILPTRAVTPDELFNNEQLAESSEKEAAVKQLPQGDWKSTTASIIKIMLNISGGLALLALTVGGSMMVLANGDEALIKKGKSVLMASVMGLTIIAISYALVIGVSEFQIFAPGTSVNSAPAKTPTSPSK